MFHFFRLIEQARRTQIDLTDEAHKLRLWVRRKIDLRKSQPLYEAEKSGTSSHELGSRISIHLQGMGLFIDLPFET